MIGEEMLLDAVAIKQARIDLNMTQEEFSESVGLSQTHISQVEQGKKGVSLKALGRIAKVLNKDFTELLLNPPQPSPPNEEAVTEGERANEAGKAVA